MADILGIDFPELPRPVAPDLAPPRYMVRLKRRIDLYAGGERVAAIGAYGVLSKVTIQPDGRAWYSYDGAAAIGAASAGYMAQHDLPDSLALSYEYKGGERFFAYK